MNYCAVFVLERGGECICERLLRTAVVISDLT